jgi:hypothetical protein
MRAEKADSKTRRRKRETKLTRDTWGQINQCHSYRWTEYSQVTVPSSHNHQDLHAVLQISRDSSVGIALGYRLDDRDSSVRFPAGAGKFLFTTRPERLWGPPSLLSNGYQGGLSLGVKRPGREAHHSPPSSAEVKEWVEVYLHSPIRLHGVVLKVQGQLYLLPFTKLKLCSQNSSKGGVITGEQDYGLKIRLKCGIRKTEFVTK